MFVFALNVEILDKKTFSFGHIHKSFSSFINSMASLFIKCFVGITYNYDANILHDDKW